MPSVSLAALLNGVRNELTHAAPVSRNPPTIRRFHLPQAGHFSAAFSPAVFAQEPSAPPFAAVTPEGRGAPPGRGATLVGWRECPAYRRCSTRTSPRRAG